MSPWSARSTWAVELHRNCSALVLSPSSLRYSPWEVTPLGAARNQKAPYSNKRYAQRHVQKAPCHCLYKGSDTAEILQDYCAKLNMIFWVLSFSIIHIFVYLLIMCTCENCTYSHRCSCCCTLAHSSVQSSDTHGPRTDSSETDTEQWQLCCRNTQG